MEARVFSLLQVQCLDPQPKLMCKKLAQTVKKKKERERETEISKCLLRCSGVKTPLN